MCFVAVTNVTNSPKKTSPSSPPCEGGDKGEVVKFVKKLVVKEDRHNFSIIITQSSIKKTKLILEEKYEIDRNCLKKISHP